MINLTQLSEAEVDAYLLDTLPSAPVVRLEAGSQVIIVVQLDTFATDADMDRIAHGVDQFFKTRQIDVQYAGTMVLGKAAKIGILAVEKDMSHDGHD